MKDKNINKVDILEVFIHIFVYAIILLLISYIFNTIEFNRNRYGIYSLVAALIIFILNKTLKPVLFRLTIPITGITWGLFYPCINIIILKIADIILGNHFNTHGVITLFFTAILISIMNRLIDNIINKIIRRSDFI